MFDRAFDALSFLARLTQAAYFLILIEAEDRLTSLLKIIILLR